MFCCEFIINIYIMKRLFTSISIALYTSVLTLAGVFPAHTSIELAKQRVTYSKSLSTSQQDIMLQAFITVDNIITMTRLNEMGVKMNSCFGNTATVTIPLSVVERLGQINGVKRIELARHLTCATTRLWSFPISLQDPMSKVIFLIQLIPAVVQQLA